MTTRETILNRVQAALDPATRALPPELPSAPRLPEDVDAQIALTMAAIEYVNGKTRRIRSKEELESALADLIRVEGIQKAVSWETEDLKILGIANTLTRLGVAIVSPRASKQELAQCDLGITGADAVLPQTGTLALRTTPHQGEIVSLLPRVHLAIFRPTALRADLSEVLLQIKNDRHAVLITGPSRTADIEKTLAIGVHGPKMLYVWSYEA